MALTAAVFQQKKKKHAYRLKSNCGVLLTKPNQRNGPLAAGQIFFVSWTKENDVGAVSYRPLNRMSHDAPCITH